MAMHNAWIFWNEANFMGANIINYNSVIENTSFKSAETACQL